jgi:NAD(P)-dependent dehydrogenase (short-subunit alcohol dehydrogenase family)
MEVNLKGPLLTTHAVLGGMVQRGNGRIINVGSYVGVLPNAMGSSYSTSKAALLRLTDCTAEGVKEAGVSVFAISPGYVKTDMTRELEEQQRAANPDFEPMDEAWVFPPEDAAVLCVRLASGEADALTGRFIHVRDNLDDMIATADEIVNQDRYALRLNVDLGV